MSRPLSSLDAALASLAPDVVFPPTPDILAGVGRRLAAPPSAARRRPWARAVALATALTLLLVATAAALAWVLPGLRITPVASVPAVPSPPLGSGLGLGAEVPAGEPQPFAVTALGPADAVRVARDGAVATLIFASRDGLPELDEGVGLLAQRIDGTLDEAMIEKLVDEVGATVVPVTVGGADGFWVAGPPHLVRYLASDDGVVRVEMTRLAGDTLVWQRGDTLYRIESPLGMEATLRLAESVDDPGTD